MRTSKFSQKTNGFQRPPEDLRLFSSRFCKRALSAVEDFGFGRGQKEKAEEPQVLGLFLFILPFSKPGSFRYPPDFCWARSTHWSLTYHARVGGGAQKAPRSERTGCC